MDPKKIHNLSKLIREQGDKLLTSEFKFTLTGKFKIKNYAKYAIS